MLDTQQSSMLLLHHLMCQEVSTGMYQGLGSIIRLYLIKSYFTQFLTKYDKIQIFTLLSF